MWWCECRLVDVVDGLSCMCCDVTTQEDDLAEYLLVDETYGYVKSYYYF